MDDKGRRISEMATRMSGFKGMKETDFPANSMGGQKFNQFGALCVTQDQHGSRWAQERNAAKAATQAKATHVESARRQLTALWETSLSGESQQPGISQNFKLPASRSAESIMEAARAAVAAATLMKSFFVSREMPENFIEVITNTIQNYEDVVSDYNLHNANATAAKAMFVSTGKQILAARRELDPIVRNKYRNDPETLALWETASRLEKQPRRSNSDEPDSVSQTPSDGQT
jgi:hypothetical protein